MYNFLLQLFEKNKTVVIPDIGAISYHTDRKPAYTFNAFLKFNDNVLAKHVATQKNIDIKEANKYVKEYTDGVLKEINAKGSFYIQKIGYLKKDGNKIILEVAEGNAAPAKAEAPKTETPKAPASPELKKEVPAAKTPEVKSAPKKTEPKPLQSVADKKDEPKLDPKAKAKVDPKAAPASKVTPTPDKTLKKPQVDTKAKKVTKEKAPKDPNAPKKKSPFLAILLGLLIGGGLIGGAIYFGLFFESNSDVEMTLQEDLAQVDSTAMEQDTLAEQEVLDDRALPTDEESAPEPAPVVSSGKYVIVAGVFEEQHNVDKMINRLKAAGYSSAGVGATLGGKDVVVFGYFNSESEANSNLSAARGVVSGAWVLKKRK